MPELLVQGCSNKKLNREAKLPAIEVYDGYFYRIIDKAARTDSLRESVDILILSAEHGLIEPGTLIRPYDRRMTEQRARELNKSVLGKIRERLTRDTYERIWVNLGADYRPAVDGLSTETTLPVVYLSGRLGKRGRQLKKILRTDESHAARRQEC